jgi:hypothetical protein
MTPLIQASVLELRGRLWRSSRPTWAAALMHVSSIEEIAERLVTGVRRLAVYTSDR